MYYHNLEKYKLDGVMIGRGALIKPWICTEIKENRMDWMRLSRRSLGHLRRRTSRYYQTVLQLWIGALGK